MIVGSPPPTPSHQETHALRWVHLKREYFSPIGIPTLDIKYFFPHRNVVARRSFGAVEVIHSILHDILFAE